MTRFLKSPATWALCLAITLLASAPSAQAEFYSYKNKEGSLVFTDSRPRIKRYKVYRYVQPEKKIQHRITLHEVRRLISRFSAKYDVEAALVEAIVKTESDYDPQAVSRKGARGLMQLMPRTASALGVSNIHNPSENLQAGIRHVRALLDRYDGNIDLVAAAYNAGSAAVARYSGVPPYEETRNYVQKVQKYYEIFRRRAVRSARQDVRIQPDHYSY